MRVLIADDQKGVATALATLVENSNHEVVDVVNSGLAAIHSYRQNKPDVVLMDYMMPRLNGVTACRHILSQNPAARIVIISGHVGQLHLAGTGAIASLAKPFGPGEINDLLKNLDTLVPLQAAA